MGASGFSPFSQGNQHSHKLEIYSKTTHQVLRSHHHHKALVHRVRTELEGEKASLRRELLFLSVVSHYLWSFQIGRQNTLQYLSPTLSAIRHN